MTESDEPSSIRDALRAIVISGGVFTAVSPVFFSLRDVLGVALGSLLAFANLWALARIGRAFLNGAGLPWVLLAAFKLLALLVAVAVLLRTGLAGVVPLAVGYGTLPVGIVLAQLVRARGPQNELDSAGYVGERRRRVRPKG